MAHSALLLLCAVVLAGCATGESGRTQRLEFPSFTVDEGVYKPRPGWTFTRGGKTGTIVVRRANTGPGIVISPCECALTTGGSCSQASTEGPNGDIEEIWCVDEGCGFCVGGMAEPDNPSLTAVRFNVVCIPGRKASRK